MTLRIKLPLLLVLTSAVLLAGPATLFNTFGPGNTWMAGPGITVGCGATCWMDAGHSSAWSFVPGEAASLSTIETAAWFIFTTPAVLNVSIHNDASGVPGTVLESFLVPLSPIPGLIMVTSATHPELQAGTRYWFTAATSDPVNMAAQLGINSIGVTGPEAFRIGSDPWIPSTSTAYAAFRVTGDSVPEPITSLLVGAGLLAFALFRIRRR
jgi:hypothetical protein